MSDTRTDLQSDASTAQPAAAAPTPGVRARLRRIPTPFSALAAPVVAGFVLGVAMPRGPMSGVAAVAAMVIAALAGTGAGMLLRSRWAMLAAPAAFAVTFELTRLGTDGPTVDGIRVSLMGAIAFVTGRGLLALVMLLPMVFGAAVGAGSVRRRRSPAAALGVGGYLRRGVAGLTAVALIGLAAVVLRPARTDPILGPDGEPLADSVAELTTADINGHDLSLMIRGHSTDNPVLLFLAGGPGGSELGAMRRHLPELEEHFTVATWDQRGAGKSYGALDPVSTYTVDSAVDDTIAVTNYLRERFDKDQVYLLGQSWGTALGVLAVQQEPDLYRAYIGTGQMVDVEATDRIMYQDTLAWAQAQDDTGLVERLTALGPPPYDSAADYETVVSYEQDVYPYDHSRNSEGAGQMGENLVVEEYTLLDQLHVLAATLDTYSVLYPQIQDIDFRETATELDVPAYFVQGRHEADGRAELFDAWYPMLEAPAKQRVDLATSGHRPLFEQPDEFVAFMTNTVLAETGNR